MKNNKKLGQAIIEYVMLLVIPILIITVLPSLNETVEMTINTVSVDLMETEKEGSVLPPTPECTNPNGCDPEPILLYPPVAKFELPTYCNDQLNGTEQRGIYRKGATIRLQDISYDTDPNGQGKIDHGEWTVQKYDLNNNEIEACSTVLRDSTIHTSRAANSGSEYLGLTISMNGYGGLTQYANCVRDPGKFKVTLRVFDNDGLLSKNIHTETFEIRDLRPSIKVSAETDSNARSSATYVSQLSQSDGCRFDLPIGGAGNEKHTQYGLPVPVNTNETGEVDFDDLDMPYIEVCPRDDRTGKDGKVTFRIESASANNFLADPDFTATDNAGTNEEEKVPEGAEDVLFTYQRHGFTYKSRYIQSSALHPNQVSDDNSQVILFDDGAATYIKEFDNPGIYFYDAQVFDENLISAQSVGTRTKSQYDADVGVAIKVLSPLDDPKYYDEQCCPGGNCDTPKITCEKPQYLLGITKSTLNEDEEQGPFYFKIGTVGDAPSTSNFRDENGNKINISTIAQLKTGLDMDILERTYTYSNDDVGTKSVTIPIFRPTVDEHLSIKGLTYFPSSTFEECQPATTSRYWATSNGWLNDFDFTKLKSGTNASWNAGEDEGSDWFEIQRPYDEHDPLIYYNAENISKMTKGASFKDDKNVEIDHVELIFGMARNLSAERDFGDVIASPFKKKINELNDKELFTGEKLNGNTNEPVVYENSAVRSNGQLIAIAPVEQSCPTHDLRPVPKFSYISDTNTIVPLTGQLKGVEPDTNTSITWNIDTKNPPSGITCIPEGCFVTVTSADSTCGEGAENCKIRAVRWEYSMYTHTPIPGSGPLTEEDIKNATFTPANSNLIQKFPLTVTKFPKYENIFFPKNQQGNYNASTIDDSEDSVYTLPINDYSGTYIYYGEYNTTAEKNEEKGQRMTSIPTFNFVQRDEAVEKIRNSGTTAPNAIPTYTDADHPNLPNDVSASGMFLEAGSSYQYNIEVIDSQGCATSRTLTINISDATKEPIPTCNFIANTISRDQLASYSYYGGLLVQGRSETTGYSRIFQNGDNIVNGNDITLYTSPIYAFIDFSRYVDGNKPTYSHSYRGYNNYFEMENNFSTDYEPAGVIAQENLQPGDFNPRFGQIAVGGNLYGILDAENSRVGEGASISESAEILNNPASGTKIEWKLYKAEFDMQKSYPTLEELLADVVELENGIQGVYGLNLVKSGDNPTPIETVYTSNLTEAPPFSANAFTEKGYYIIELSISYSKDGELYTSSPTNCNLRVSIPTLDFKCPWGETYNELRGNILTLKAKIKGGNYSIDPTDDIFSVLTNDRNYTKTNMNPYITEFEFTNIINKDYNGLDEVESTTPTYADVPLISFKPNDLNDKWQKAKEYGVYINSFTEDDFVVCSTADCGGEYVIYPGNDLLLGSDYEYIKNSPTLNPLTITVNGVTQTMSLQGWLMRERYFRDSNLYEHPDPTYLDNMSGTLTPAQIEQERQYLRESLPDGFEAAIDDIYMNIGKFIPELYNLRDYKVYLAQRLQNSYKETYSFLDLQPSAVKYFSKFIIIDGVEPSDTSWFAKYTGTVRVDKDFVNIADADKRSIRKGNADYSNIYGTIDDKTSTYISTPFMGKYEAAKRFENLNQSNFAGQNGFITSENSYNNRFDLKNDGIIGAKGGEMFDIVSAPLNYKNYYINPMSVYVNNVGQSESINSKKISASSDFSDNDGYYFTSLPSTLDVNRTFLSSSNIYEYNVDRETLNAVAWDHGFKLGWYTDVESAPTQAAISYIRVNSVDKNTILKDSENAENNKVYNSYSKLCPIMVEMITEDTAKYSSCSINYTNPSNGAIYSPFNTASKKQEDLEKVGILKDGNGTLITNNYAGLNPGAFYHKDDIASINAIPTPKIYTSENEHNKNEYNLADIHLDYNAETELILKNEGQDLNYAIYRFYRITSGSIHYIPFEIRINYDLANQDLSNSTNIDNVVTKAIRDFDLAYYEDIDNGDYRPKIRNLVSPTTSTASHEEKDHIKFDYSPIYYQVDYYTSDGKKMIGNNSTAHCTIYVANEIPYRDTDSNNNPYVLEIGSWNYRIQFPNSSVMSASHENYNTFYHWDRTYDYNYYMNNPSKSTAQRMRQLETPNEACKWKTEPVFASNSLENRKVGATYVQVAQKGAPTLFYGGHKNTGENGGCIVAGSTDAPRTGMTEKSEAVSNGIASKYSIVAGYNWNDTTDNYAGFYVTTLNLLAGNASSDNYNSVYNQCYKRAYANGSVYYGHDINVIDGSSIKEDAGKYWCSAGTLYALTDRNHRIEQLSGTQVIEVIMNNNGNTRNSSQTKGNGGHELHEALEEQVNACYGKSC